MLGALLLNWLAQTPVMAMPLLLAGLGTLIAGRAGVLNLGAEGMMLCGALAAAAVSFHTGSAWAGIVAAPLAGAALSLLFAVACVTLRSDQVVTGLVLAAIGAGATGILGPAYAQRAIDAFARPVVPVLSEIPWVGRIVFGQDALFYLLIPLVAVTVRILDRSLTGLRLRAVGEDPAAADAAAIEVQRWRFRAVLVGGAFCGLGGGYLALAASQIWVEGMVNGRGWIAVALVIFARWTPLGVVFGAILFGGIEALVPRLQAVGVAVPTFLLFMLPYLATLAALIVAAIRRRDTEGEPGALGRPYLREDRR